MWGVTKETISRADRCGSGMSGNISSVASCGSDLGVSRFIETRVLAFAGLLLLSISENFWEETVSGPRDDFMDEAEVMASSSEVSLETSSLSFQSFDLSLLIDRLRSLGLLFDGCKSDEEEIVTVFL